MRELSACSVSHCYDAQAVALSFPNGFKVSYSGDCRPSKKFAEIGKDSTVLIHEATFDDEMQGDAEAKKHSTTSEAIGVGLAMRARRVVLTHFSQRYQKIPVMENLAVEKVKLEDTEDRDLDEPMVDAEAAAVSVDGSPDEVPTDGVAANDEHAATTNVTQPDKTGLSQLPLEKSTDPMVAWKPTQVEQPSNVLIPFSATQDMKVCVAFDYMKVKVGEIEYMEKLTPTLLKLYQTGDLDDITEKQAGESVKAKSKNESKGKTAEKPEKSNEEINRGKKKRGKLEVKNRSQEEERNDVRVGAPKEINIVDEYQSNEELPRAGWSSDGDTGDRFRMIETPKVRRLQSEIRRQPQAKSIPNGNNSASARSIGRVSADRQDISGRSRSTKRRNKAADKRTDQQARSPTLTQTHNSTRLDKIQMHDHKEQVENTTKKLNSGAVSVLRRPTCLVRIRQVVSRRRSNRGAVAKTQGRKRKTRMLVETPCSTHRYLPSHTERLSRSKNPAVEPQGPTSPAGKDLSHPEQCTPLRTCIPEPKNPPRKYSQDTPLHISKHPPQQNRPTVRRVSVQDASLLRQRLQPEGKADLRLRLIRSTARLI